MQAAVNRDKTQARELGPDARLRSRSNSDNQPVLLISRSRRRTASRDRTDFGLRRIRAPLRARTTDPTRGSYDQQASSATSLTTQVPDPYAVTAA
jgi:hypothetical protein